MPIRTGASRIVVPERSAFSGWVIVELAILIGGIYLAQQAPLFGIGEPGWRLVQVVVAAAITIVILNLVTRAITWLYVRRQYGRRQGTKNFIYGVENLRQLLLGFVVVFSLFSLIGIDFSTLFTSLSIVAAAIAIVSKDFVNDLIVGIYHSFTDVFEVGDYVKFYNTRGRVIDIGLLKVKLLNDNDDVIILPNGKVYANEIINHTRRDLRLMSIDFEMDIRSINNIDALERDLTETLVDYAAEIEPDSYLLKVVDVRKDFMEMKFQFRLITTDRRQQREFKRQMVRRVYSHVGGTHQNRVVFSRPSDDSNPQQAGESQGHPVHTG